MQAKNEPFLRRTIAVRPKFIAFIALSLALVFGIAYSVQSARTRRLRAERSDVQVSVLDAYEYAQELEMRLAFTATDEYIEQEARERFGYMAENETRYILEPSYSSTKP